MQSSALPTDACAQRHVEVIRHGLPDDDNAFIRQRQITGGKYYRKRRGENGENTETVVVEIGVLPISKSTWLRGVQTGRYPSPIRVGDIALYRVSDIRALLKRISDKGSE